MKVIYLHGVSGRAEICRCPYPWFIEEVRDGRERDGEGVKKEGRKEGKKGGMEARKARKNGKERTERKKVGR
jgi:hypothetical protein